MPTNASKLLFICTGNTCRSQMAHALAHQWAESHLLKLDIKSRGTAANHGDATTIDALLVMQAVGIDWQGSSQLLSLDDLKWADYVWVMTQEQLVFTRGLAEPLPQDCLPPIELIAPQVELLDPLNLGFTAYQDLWQSLTSLLPWRLAALQRP